MKLWLLRPRRERPRGGKDPWTPWYDRCFGFVIRAESEFRARQIAAENANAEWHSWDEHTNPWLVSGQSSCEELTTEGPEGKIIEDVHSA